MPLRHTVPPLAKICMLNLNKNWDLICYSAHSPREMAELLENDGYLEFQGPFTHCPSSILEELMEIVRARGNLSRKYLHLLLREQLLKLNLSFGVGEIYYGLQFLPRCKRLRELNLSYLRHVEPSHIIQIIPCLGSIVSLNLGMTLAHDLMLRRIAQHCPNLVDLNLQSTFISDEGLMALVPGSGGGCWDGSLTLGGCPLLQRIVVTETKITWLGALTLIQGLRQLRDFDFDRIFQVFEHIDPSSLPPLSLRALYSTTPSIRGESVNTAAVLCPNVEILSITGCWMDNDNFYKFMQFEHLKTLSVFNCEGKTIDYGEGILPMLQIIGPTLENLILSKFSQVDLVSLGRSCPRLRKLALSEIGEIGTAPGGNALPQLFSYLTNLELWLDSNCVASSSNALSQLLQNATLLENLLVKKSESLTLSLLQKIWISNPMVHLSRIMLDGCNQVEGDAIKALLQMENELSTIRIWSCSKIKVEDKTELKNLIEQAHLYVYLEWFE